MDTLQLMSDYKAVRDEEPLFRNSEMAIVANQEAEHDGIMLVGMNPSGDGDGIIHNYLAKPDDFFKPKHEMMGKYNHYCGYIDLFPFRNGRQNVASNEDEIRFRGKLLSHTRDYIEFMNPRLIIYANTAISYWGFNGDWMGYKFMRIPSPLSGDKQCWPLFKITGILPTDVNRHSIQSNLVDHSYFLRYRQHENKVGKAVPPSKMLTPDDIKVLADYIDKDWASRLVY